MKVYHCISYPHSLRERKRRRGRERERDWDKKGKRRGLIVIIIKIQVTNMNEKKIRKVKKNYLSTLLGQTQLNPQ